MLLTSLPLALACSRQPGPRSSPGAAAPPPAVELLEWDRGGTAAEPEPMAAPPGPRETIAGQIVLPAARRASVAKGDTIFISARKPMTFPGAAGLLAAQRLQVEDFPLPFALSARDAMVAGTSFGGTVNITVRVDKDGDPLTRQRGDLYGQVVNVKVGTAGVVVSLDSLQAEDVTLAGGSMLDRAGLPPGHP